MQSIYTELALYRSKNECAWNDNVVFSISEVCDGTVSLIKLDGVAPFTGPLKPNVASKNPWMGDYMQEKGLDEGFDLVYVAPIFIGGNIN